MKPVDTNSENCDFFTLCSINLSKAFISGMGNAQPVFLWEVEWTPGPVWTGRNKEKSSHLRHPGSNPGRLVRSQAPWKNIFRWNIGGMYDLAIYLMMWFLYNHIYFYLNLFLFIYLPTLFQLWCCLPYTLVLFSNILSTVSELCTGLYMYIYLFVYLLSYSTLTLKFHSIYISFTL